MESLWKDIPITRQIINARTFTATMADMQRAWTQPEFLSKWWGPAGFTNTFHEFDFRPGGKWRLTMYDENKASYENEWIFKSTDPDQCLIWDHVSAPEFILSVCFKEVQEQKIAVVFRMIFDSEELCTMLRAVIPEKNEENFDKLEKLLVTIA